MMKLHVVIVAIHTNPSHVEIGRFFLEKNKLQIPFTAFKQYQDTPNLYIIDVDVMWMSIAQVSEGTICKAVSQLTTIHHGSIH